MMLDQSRALKGVPSIRRIVLTILLLIRLSDGQYTSFGSYPICYVCGSDEQKVGNPEVAVQIPPGIIGLDEISCGTIAVIGIFGQLPPFFCAALQSFDFFKMSCGCEDVMANSDATEGSSTPTKDDTSAPSSADSYPLPTFMPTAQALYSPSSGPTPRLSTLAPTIESDLEITMPRPIYMDVNVQVNPGGTPTTPTPTSQLTPSTYAPTEASDLEITMPRPIYMDVSVQINPGPTPAPARSGTFPPRGPASPTAELSFATSPQEAPASASSQATPTLAPLEIISNEPTNLFSTAPTIEASSQPSVDPSGLPSLSPTSSPSTDPTSAPVLLPSSSPTLVASAKPSETLSQPPSIVQSTSPSNHSAKPTQPLSSTPTLPPSLPLFSGQSDTSFATRPPSAMNDQSEDSVSDGEEVSCSIVFSFVLRFCSPDADEVTSLFHNICDSVRYTCGVGAEQEQGVVEGDIATNEIGTDAPTRAPLAQKCGLVGRASVNFCDPMGDDILSVLRAYCHWIKQMCTAE